jgi:hypothetical protein
MFLLVLVPFLSHGQKFSVGVRGGALINWAGFGDKEDKDIYSRKIKPGFAGGIFISFPLRDKWNLIVEGGYSQRGRRLLFNDNSWENNTTYKFVDMSMLLRRSFKFHIKENIPVEAFVNLGPEINYWMSAKGFLRVGGSDGRKFKYDVVFDDVKSGGDLTTVHLSEMNRWLFSLSLGVGFKAPIRKNQHLFTELRFISGHTFLGSKESTYLAGMLRGEGNFQDTQRTNLKAISFSLGYAFDLDVIESRKGKSTLKKTIKRNR